MKDGLAFRVMSYEISNFKFEIGPAVERKITNYKLRVNGAEVSRAPARLSDQGPELITQNSAPVIGNRSRRRI